MKSDAPVPLALARDYILCVIQCVDASVETIREERRGTSASPTFSSFFFATSDRSVVNFSILLKGFLVYGKCLQHLGFQDMHLAREDKGVQGLAKVHGEELLKRTGDDLLVIRANTAEANSYRGLGGQAALSLLLDLQQLLHSLIHGHEARGLVDLAPTKQVLNTLLLDLDVYGVAKNCV